LKWLAARLGEASELDIMKLVAGILLIISGALLVSSA
jgi:hypothetical protein